MLFAVYSKQIRSNGGRYLSVAAFVFNGPIIYSIIPLLDIIRNNLKMIVVGKYQSQLHYVIYIYIYRSANCIRIILINILPAPVEFPRLKIIYILLIRC